MICLPYKWRWRQAPEGFHASVRRNRDSEQKSEKISKILKQVQDDRNFFTLPFDSAARSDAVNDCVFLFLWFVSFSFNQGLRFELTKCQVKMEGKENEMNTQE